MASGSTSHSAGRNTAGRLTGWRFMTGSKKGYELYINISRSDQCNGFARIQNKRWAIACPDG